MPIPRILPTVKVYLRANKKAGAIIINSSDFDESIHEVYESLLDKSSVTSSAAHDSSGKRSRRSKSSSEPSNSESCDTASSILETTTDIAIADSAPTSSGGM